VCAIHNGIRIMTTNGSNAMAIKCLTSFKAILEHASDGYAERGRSGSEAGE
jgi:hypothetical protein